ncbi:Ehd1 [Symbiodinium sp. CCMP2592]|nr:Ehd1 [Symbiodinium sp. CCMP2592]
MQKLNLAHDGIARQLQQQETELMTLRRDRDTMQKRLKDVEEDLMSVHDWRKLSRLCKQPSPIKPATRADAAARMGSHRAESEEAEAGRTELSRGCVGYDLLMLNEMLFILDDAAGRAALDMIFRAPEHHTAKPRQRLFGSEGRLKELPNLMKTPQMIYEEKLRPLEKQLQFENFYDTAELSAAYFTSKPMVLVLGQYSTGKSTLISQLLKAEYPGLRIGPEPTTDKFVAIMGGPSRQQLPGFALCSNPSQPFGQLQRFGSRFLERFEGALMPEEEVPVLSCLSFVDTPGVLSGDKQRVGRSYDFEGVMGWFAENADLVIVLFDPNKLDISDEFRRCLEALSKKSESKIRFVLNKAEKLDRFELARVFGALMWSLSKVINSPEMPHVFLSPASNQLDLSKEALAFFQSEGERLRQELFQVPLDNTTRKVNDLLRRGRLLRCHALLVQQLLTLRGPFGRRKVLRETITDPVKLAAECAKVAQSSGIPLQDFPSAATLTAQFLKMGDTPVQEVPSPLLRKAEEALSKDIPALLDRVSSEREQMIQEGLPMLDLLLDSRTKESAAAE